MITVNKSLHLFQGYGVELEYMIVDERDLAVNPISDSVLQAIAGEIASEVEVGDIAWSNELVLHVIELKTNGPSPTLTNLSSSFQRSINKINTILKKYHAKLLPTGAHPLMHPDTETRLWPHDNNEIYQAFNEIFDCRGHGWSNLQSTHLNLPFDGNDEFIRLHAAIRLLLPIIPALTASTPILDGKLTGYLDTRLEYYRTNQENIPSITGLVIPEVVTSIANYHETILQPMYQAISPKDHRNILQEEWLNSRGAIARFDRNAIEIRIIDIQESAEADIAILSLVVKVLKLLIKEHWSTFATQLHFSHASLVEIFQNAITKGLATVIKDQSYLALFGLQKRESCSIKELWQHILSDERVTEDLNTNLLAVPKLILSKGNLSNRIITALNKDYSRANIIKIYQQLADCLSHGTIFNPEKN
jgi:glutamate---cysteine ligase / carboxylate-amine ligase